MVIVGNDNNQLRDAAEYIEASQAPEEYQDSLEDKIHEALHPHRLHPELITKLCALFIEEVKAVDDNRYCSADLETRAAILRDVMEKFDPSNWSLTHWWAIQFATRSAATHRLSPSDISKLLGLSRQGLSNKIRAWRKKLRLPSDPGLQKHAVQLNRQAKRELTTKHRPRR